MACEAWHFAEEASFYFSQLSMSPGSQSPLCIALANAQVALHTVGAAKLVRGPRKRGRRRGIDGAQVRVALAVRILPKAVQPSVIRDLQRPRIRQGAPNGL